MTMRNKRYIGEFAAHLMSQPYGLVIPMDALLSKWMSKGPRLHFMTWSGGIDPAKVHGELAWRLAEGTPENTIQEYGEVL